MSKAHHPLADAAAHEPSDAARDGGAGRWLSYLAGLGILAVVIFAALHFADERELVRIAKAAEPWWLGVAVVLQAGTYLAQSRCWRAVTRAAKVVLPLLAACKLSLTKLFIDQALPSAGISGSVVVARALERRGIARPVVMATVVVDMIAYYAAYVPALALAVTITVVDGHASPLVIAAALGFVAFSIALMAATLAVSGRTTLRAKWTAHIPALRRALGLLHDADPTLVRRLPVLFESALFQLLIVLLDVATVWVLVRSLGEVASPAGIFVSFMLSSLLRTVSIVPGGLGAFEAASVYTLKATGVPLTVGLAATLLFRGLSFWLPMLPGLLFMRSERRPA